MLWKNKLKLLAVFILSLVALLIVVGCGAQKDNQVDKEEKVIKVGIIGPMQFMYGQHMWDGATLAAEHINEAGGVKVGDEKYKIQLVKEDSNEFTSVNDALSALEKLLTVDKVDFIHGLYRSEAVLAGMEVAADYKKIYLTGLAASIQITQKIPENYDRYKYLFKIGPYTNREQALCFLVPVDLAIRNLKEQGITPKVAIVADSALWAEEIVKNGQELIPKMGGEIVGVWRTGFSDTDLTPVLSAAKASGANIIYPVLAGPASAVFGKQYGMLKIPAIAAGVVMEAIEKDFWEASSGNVNYIVAVASFSGISGIKVTEETEPFRKAIEERYGRTPSSYDSGSYYSIKGLVDSIERAGTLETDAVIDALEKIDMVTAEGRIRLQPPDHPFAAHATVYGPDAIFTPVIQWQDGERVLVFPDGKEINPVLIEAGLKSGYEGLKLEGSGELKLPPWLKK